MKATKHASLFQGWKLDGKDEQGQPVSLCVRYIKNKPDPYLTYFEAENVVSELVEDTLVLLDEKFIPESYRKDWDTRFNPDYPRGLAKTVCVK